MNLKILNTDVQQFIKDFDVKNIYDLVLKNPVYKDINNAELANQIMAYYKSAQKLPLWYNSENIYYPTPLSIEQTSSEITAALKASWFSGNSFLDTTGGFGVDSYFFSKHFEKGIHCEIQTELSKIVSHNFESLGVENVSFYNGNGLDYLLEYNGIFDLVYLDPARRASSKKVFKLSDCTPDFLPILDQMMEKSKIIMLKTSPLLDISLSIKELKYVSAIHINSVKNECKELIFILDKENCSPNPQIYTHVYKEGNWRMLSFPFLNETNLHLTEFAAMQNYLYEPDVALTKAAWFKTTAQFYQISKIAIHTHLYTSDEYKDKFLGKIFKVDKVFTLKEFKNLKNENGHIVSKNFPLKPEEIAKKYKITEGGELYYFFYQNHKNEKMVAIALRLK